MRTIEKFEVKEFGAVGQKYVEENKDRIHQCIAKVFTNKNLLKKLDLINWPLGKHKDRSIEAVKTLIYLFNKLYLTFANCTEKKLLCLYCDAIDKFLVLLNLAASACFNVESLDVLKNIIGDLGVIQSLAICKCSRHLSEGGEIIEKEENDEVGGEVEVEMEASEEQKGDDELSRISAFSKFSKISSTGVDPNSSYATMIPIIKHIMDRIDTVQKYVDEGSGKQAKQSVMQDMDAQNVSTKTLDSTSTEILTKNPPLTLVIQHTNQLCSCVVCKKTLNTTLPPQLKNPTNCSVVSLDKEIEMVSVICLACTKKISLVNSLPKIDGLSQQISLADVISSIESITEECPPDKKYCTGETNNQP
ncbi:MAG: hypothetical protein Harvfovirus4_52 [Harvfovirus sp.]|uniref:Uncharacterized protein n=1 Tax=Harvfovirus sp. TaxID=2487768 RepID=A0A3G5A0H6_9VIRU|nr:MAG: hypothetical protein Harvfovirus4_52 [Harvfovirus sp.]